ncbi:MAG: IS630 family transposase [Desulfovibrio sp.]|nr:IS630 family transposase [Desulfovibrio sp.]
MIADDSRVLVFQDEVHFQVTTSVTRKWAQKGSKPKVASSPRRKNVPYSGYVIPETGELLTMKTSWFNYETVIQSYRDFMAEYPVADGKKVCIVIDNAPWHKKAFRLVQEEALEEYSDIREKIELIKLPPYSPDLNPIEQCWRITRRDVTHNTYFPNERVLQEALDDYFRQYRKPNKRLESLCSFKYKN